MVEDRFRSSGVCSPTYQPWPVNPGTEFENFGDPFLAHRKPNRPPSRGVPVGILSEPTIEVQRKTWPNKYEQAFADMARNLGWDITKRGWPDFICYAPSGEVIVVEVKPPGQDLRKPQWLCMRFLSQLGLKCFISDGEVLKPFDPDLPPAWEDESGKVQPAA